MTPATPRQPESSTGLSPRLAAALAYGGWWVTGLVFWFVERHDRHVRFHAAQSMAAFGLLAAVMAVFGAAAAVALLARPGAAPVFLWALGLTWIGAVLLWVVALWQVARGRAWRMPLAAGLADRMLAGD